MIREDEVTEDVNDTVIANQCQAIKSSDGLQCTRKLKNNNKGDLFCSQHASKAKNVHKCTDVEPWTLLGLVDPYESNGKRILQKIRTKLKKGPKASDGSGWIYIYCLQHEEEQKLNYYKVGRTNRRVTHRMKEWDDLHKQHGGANHKVILKDQYQVTHGIDFCERLIHLYLSYCNIHRYPTEKGTYHSVWAMEPRKALNDGQGMKEEGERLVAKNKHIEWFCKDLHEIQAVVKSICTQTKWTIV